jgi:hypothetical protein
VKYDRTVIAYHGCDVIVAERVLAGEPFRKSENNYDWLGAGIYFWEFGVDRARKFAEFQEQLGKVGTPAVATLGTNGRRLQASASPTDARSNA